MCGKPLCRPEERRQGADLGLYSITFHAALARIGVRPYRKLEDDLRPSLRAAAYGSARPASRCPANVAKAAQPGKPEEPDFTKMSQAEKVAWNLDRWKRILG
jgi:hypothetical protein